jgi:hypothetical protein
MTTAVQIDNISLARAALTDFAQQVAYPLVAADDLQQLRRSEFYAFMADLQVAIDAIRDLVDTSAETAEEFGREDQVANAFEALETASFEIGEAADL